MNSIEVLRSVVLSVSLLLVGFSSEGQSQNMRFSRVMFEVIDGNDVYRDTVPSGYAWKITAYRIRGEQNHYNNPIYQHGTLKVNGIEIAAQSYIKNPNINMNALYESDLSCQSCSIWLGEGDFIELTCHPNHSSYISILEYELY